MSDEIPYESTAETADGHLTAAENYLAIAEGQRETLEGGTDLHDAADAVASGMQTGLLFSTACTLADLHRRMAETYWNQPRTLTSVAEQPGDDLLAEMRAQLEEKMAEDAKAFDAAQEPPCACCSAGLADASSRDDECATCGHYVDLHNVTAPKEADPRDGLNGPGESTLIEAARLTGSAGWRQVSEWLAACADANREGKHWPPLIAAPPSVMGPMKGGNVPVSEYSHGLSFKDQWRKAVQSLSDQGFEDLLTLAAEERRRRQEENGVQINAREPKPWRSPGGAGQWNG